MILLATIAFNRPRLISEQIRLLERYLHDPFRLIVFDTSTDMGASAEIHFACEDKGVEIVRLSTHKHHEALNEAVSCVANAPYFGFLDHDIFPIRATRLISLIDGAGFYGVGQRHPATGHLYLWPGFCFFSREWINGRSLDFSGLRDGDMRNDGDTGSCLWPLFADEDWKKLYRVEHSYEPIRRPDAFGLQSWGFERLGDWIHFSNASNWKSIPDPEERDRLLFGLLEKV